MHYNNCFEFEELLTSIWVLTLANAVLPGKAIVAESVKQIFSTVKYTIDDSNSSNIVLLFLF